MTLYVDNDNVLVLEGLKNAVTGAFLNSVSGVQATISTLDGTAVTGDTNPVPMAYVASSDGEYRGTAGDALALTDGQSYQVHLVADGGAGLKLDIEILAIARVRRRAS